MNVSCTSCSAKYAIPDDKVRGKKVKITCKHCGTGIIVDGTKIDATGEPVAAVAPATAAAVAPAAAPAPAPAVSAPAAVAVPKPAAAVPAAAMPAAAAELSFDIAYPDDQQETLSVSQIVAKYAAGTLTDEAFIWREGMPDWKAPFDIPEIAKALTARGIKPKSAGAAPVAAPAAAAAAPVAARAPGAAFGEEDEATKVQESPFEGLPADIAGEWREPAKEAPSNPQAAFDLRAPAAALPFEKPEPAPLAASPKLAPLAASPKPAAAIAPATAAPVAAAPAAAKPAAARRNAARGGGDLFGDLAAAGSEDDETLGIDAKEAAPKMTGARNESSVLFSLDALTKQEQKPAAKKAAPKQDDAALLMGLDSGPSSLANVGNAFNSAFAAPDFSAPVAAAPAPDVRPGVPATFAIPEAPPKKKSGGVWIALLAVVVLGGGAAAMVLSGKVASTAPAPTPSATAATTTTSEPTPSPTPSAEAAPASTGSAAASPSAVVATGGAAATPAPPTTTGAAPVAATPKPTEAGTKPTEKPAEKPPEKPAEKPAEAAAGAPFDTAAAKAALGSAAANAGSCKTADGPTGSGKVSVTFMPSGRATNTQVSGDLAGTAVGGCVARLFRSAKVPPFAGDAVTVTKSFSVQ